MGDILMITGLVIALLLLIILILALMCLQRQARISSLRKEAAFLKASLQVLAQRQEEYGEMTDEEESVMK